MHAGMVNLSHFSGGERRLWSSLEGGEGETTASLGVALLFYVPRHAAACIDAPLVLVCEPGPIPASM